MIILCQGSKIFCIKDIRIYVVIRIINNNVATEITLLQKNSSSKESSPIWEFNSPCPSENLTPLDSNYPPLSFWNLASKAIFFAVLPFFHGGGCILCQSCLLLLVFVICHLFCKMPQSWLSRVELSKCTPNILIYSCDFTICPSLSILFLHAPAHEAWIFVFELEAFWCDFKIDCIIVWQVMYLNKKMVMSSGKFNIFI